MKGLGVGSGQPRDGAGGGSGLSFMNGAAPAAIAGRRGGCQQRASGGRRSPVRPAPVPVPPPMAAGRRTPPEPGGGPVLLQGVFGAGPTPGATVYSLALTARELQVRRPGCSSGGSAGPDAALRLADCVGSSAFPAAVPAACFSLVCYPLRGSRWGSPSRQRLERTFNVCLAPDAEGNLRIAQAWSRRIRELAVPAVPAQDGGYRGATPRETCGGEGDSDTRPVPVGQSCLRSAASPEGGSPGTERGSVCRDRGQQPGVGWGVGAEERGTGGVG